MNRHRVCKKKTLEKNKIKLYIKVDQDRRKGPNPFQQGLLT